MRKTTLSFGAAAVLAFGLSAIPAAYAQEGEAGTGAAFDAGNSMPMAPRCPSIGWHVQPVAKALPATITGVAYYSDMSGFSMIKGTVAADGSISGSLTSTSGNGPVGVISGQRKKYATDVVLKGAGCANAKFHLLHYSRSGAAAGF